METPNRMAEIEEELRAIELRRKSLLTEMNQMRQQLESPQLPLTTGVPRSSDEKIVLFLSLFGVRQSVYRFCGKIRETVAKAIHPHAAMNGSGESVKSPG